MNKERVLFLVFHNRCHRVILGFHQFFHQLVIEVAADFTGSVEIMVASSPGVHAGQFGRDGVSGLP